MGIKKKREALERLNKLRAEATESKKLAAGLKKLIDEHGSSLSDEDKKTAIPVGGHSKKQMHRCGGID